MIAGVKLSWKVILLSSYFVKRKITLKIWIDGTYPVSEDCARPPVVSDHPCPARRCRTRRQTGSGWQWRGRSPPDWPCRLSWRASPPPPPRQSAPGSRASISRPRGRGWKPDKYQRCEKGGGYKVKTDGFLRISANESYFKLQQFFINVKLEWRRCRLIVEMEISSGSSYRTDGYYCPEISFSHNLLSCNNYTYRITSLSPDPDMANWSWYSRLYIVL